MFKSFQDILKDLFEYVGANKLITDFNVGSVLRTILEAVAAIAEEVWYQLRAFVNLFFLDTSQGEWIDRRLQDLGMERKAGTAAYGEITIGRDSPAPIGVSIPSGTIFQNDTGELQYTTQADAVLNIGDTNVDVVVQAADVGTEYNLVSGTVLKQSGIALSGIEWVKIKLMGGGEDTESDDDYKNRVPEYFDSLSRGTEPAIIYAAKDVDGVKSVTLQDNQPDKGWFTLYIDDGSGVANDTLLQSVRAELEDYRAFTIHYVVDTAKILDFSAQIAVAIIDGNSADEVRAAVKTAIITYINNLKMGESLYLADLIYLARGVAGVQNVQVLAPATDTIAATDQLLRTTADKVVIQ